MARRAPRKQRIGRVASNAMEKTAVVTVDTLVKHPLYGKTIKKSKNFYAHDENNQCEVGDIVKIVETRPLSKTKRWKVVSVVEKAK